MDDDTPETRPPTPRAQPAPLPTEAELSRIAREAVHQPADVRLDKQLARMGLLDASDAAAPRVAPRADGPVGIDPELDHLRDQVRRMRLLIALLVGAVAILVVAVVVLLAR